MLNKKKIDVRSANRREISEETINNVTKPTTEEAPQPPKETTEEAPQPPKKELSEEEKRLKLIFDNFSLLKGTTDRIPIQIRFKTPVKEDQEILTYLINGSKVHGSIINTIKDLFRNGIDKRFFNVD